MKRFGKYLLERQLAIGGMAEIFLARQHGPAGFEKTLVIKRILPHFANDETFITMFLDEARTSAKLNHPNLVQIYELGETEGSYYIAMEYIRGESLSKVIKRLKKHGMHMPLHLASKIIASTCAGLDYAHNFGNNDGEALNLVHRDISPDNILVSFDGAVKMIDFGIAKARENESKTQAGSVKGKFCYMSPEQVTGKRLDRRSDIFSLGIVLHELTTLAKPFGDGADLLTVSAIVNDEPKCAADFLEGYPAPLWDIISKTLTKDRDDRYQNAHELQIALEKFIHSRGEFLSDRDIGAYLRKLFSEKDDDISELRDMASGIRTRIIIPPTGEIGEVPMTVIEPSDAVAETVIAEPPSDITGRQPSVGAEVKAKETAAAAALAAQEKQAAANAATRAVPALTEADIAAPKPAPAETKKSPAGLWIGLIMLLAALGVGGWFAYQHFAGDESGAQKPTPQAVADPVGETGESDGTDGVEQTGTNEASDGGTDGAGDGTASVVVDAPDVGVAATAPDAGAEADEPDTAVEAPDAEESPEVLAAALTADAENAQDGTDALDSGNVEDSEDALDARDGTDSANDAAVAAETLDANNATTLDVGPSDVEAPVEVDATDAGTPPGEDTVDATAVDAASLDTNTAAGDADVEAATDAGEQTPPTDTQDTTLSPDTVDAGDNPAVDAGPSEEADAGSVADAGQPGGVIPAEKPAPKTGSLKVYSKSKVTVYINGKRRGSSPLTLKLPVGKTTVHAKGNGIDNYFKMNIKAGETSQLHVPQPAKTGKLVFKIGKQYRIKVGGRSLAPGTRALNVRPGKHRITITDPKNPGRSAIKTVTVRANKPTVVTL